MNQIYMCRENGDDLVTLDFKDFVSKDLLKEGWHDTWTPFYAERVADARTQAFYYFEGTYPFRGTASTTGVRKIYLASSWRNEQQPRLVETLRAAGHEVYDFRNPTPGNTGFSWRDVDQNWREWTPAQFKAALQHPVSRLGLGFDFAGMRWANTIVALSPFGRSASLELGWGCGARKATAVMLAPGEPELMFGLAGKICLDEAELLEWLSTPALR